MTGHANPPILFDLPSLWDMNAKPLDFAQRAYTAWVDAATEMQSHAAEFLNNRLAMDSAAVTKLAQCSTPLEILGVQADYAREAFADFVTEGQKIANWFSAAQANMLAGVSEPSRTSRRA
jgi:hypothetical protein